MGQWTHQTLTCKNHHKLTIITAYQSCQHGNNSARTKIHTLTVHAQQTSILRQQGCTCTSRQAFLVNLSTFIKGIKSTTHHILLLGNFNEPLDTPNSGMLRVCQEHNLIDLMFQATGTDQLSTYQ